MSLASGFVYLSAVDASILQDVRYAGSDNFLGRPVRGYLAPVTIMTQAAANALVSIQNKLRPQHLSLKVFDAYRPTTAVEDFVVWSADASDQKMKEHYYPHVNKADFFRLGYVAELSSHTRGSTVDLTIVQVDAEGRELQELDMGTPFDFMDDTSNALSKAVSMEAQNNRKLLRQLMIDAGFQPYDMEWWHFTLEQEPFPETYFSFAVA